MNRIISLALTALTALTLLGATTARAQPARAPLAPEVKQTLRDTRARFAPQIAPIKRDLRDARQALRDELARPQPSDATLRQLEDRMIADRQRLAQLHAQADAELRARLSPRDYARVLMKRAARMHHHGGRGGSPAQVAPPAP
ncbi:MAG TPA: periplasmic heavy metal sensor [Kofleriaceae bacterium]|nr:periplasmic heavy metal sensor [Kofleriaceae bacterium]